ncbi:helix-turn-helix domain-containing protein [Maricaulis sp.]|uniref:helix-turn-helix domain-containing protein n=1 Tax=Maricaulis sp. TaxID=1486257 RepID=UPI003A9483EB
MVQDINFTTGSSKVNWPSIIRNFRMSKRLKQAALAADLGVTQAMISRWENGESDPPDRVKRRMADLVQDAFVVAPAPTWIDLVTLNPGIEFVTDSSGVLKAISAGALDVFGLSREAVEGRPIERFLGGDFARTMETLRSKGMFRSDLVFAQSLGTVEVTTDTGPRTVLCDFIHWPRLSEVRAVFCVHSGAVLDQKKYDSRLEERGQKIITRKTF